MSHPDGILIDIVGINEPSRGRSCEEHGVCGSILQLDTVVRLRSVQIIVDGGLEQTAIAAYWVTDGIDRCRVGFLPRHCVKHASLFENKLAQVVEFLDKSESPSERRRYHHNLGLCRAALIEAKQEGQEEDEAKLAEEDEAKEEGEGKDESKDEEEEDAESKEEQEQKKQTNKKKRKHTEKSGGESPYHLRRRPSPKKK
jgi:hypothetical protein